MNNSRLAILALSLLGLLLQTDSIAAKTLDVSYEETKTEVSALCKRLPKVRKIPFKGESINDKAYNEIVGRGKAAIPCLINRVTDVTKMKDPRSAPAYPDFKVGDLAFFLLVEITKTPFDQMLPDSVKAKMKDEGVYAYFKYVERFRNRKALQQKWRAFSIQ